MKSLGWRDAVTFGLLCLALSLGAFVWNWDAKGMFVCAAVYSVLTVATSFAKDYLYWESK